MADAAGGRDVHWRLGDTTCLRAGNVIRAVLSFFGALIGFVCTVQLICCLTILLVFGNAVLHAAGSTLPTVKAIHSMQRCGPCERVIAKYKTDGGKLTDPKPTEIQHATSYPTVIYSDDSWDNGARVLKGQCCVNADKVPLTELVQP